jgi:cytochrome P450
MVAHSATPSIMGSNFLANFPDFFESIWTLDRAFLLLGMGLPRWLPLPLMTRAHIAQRKMFNQLILFHEAMEKEASGQDPGADWRDIDDVSTLVKERTKVYRKYGLSMTTRVGFEEALLWATNAKSNTLIFWMLNRIYADKDLLARIRKEIAPYASAVQPKQEFPVPEAPRWASFDVEGLCANCPLLKSCYLECLRLDTATWSQRVVQQDFVLEASEKRAQRWLLRKGEYADVAHELHNTDPNSFDDPMQWRADRHVRKMDNEKTATADIGSLRPYGRLHVDI